MTAATHSTGKLALLGGEGLRTESQTFWQRLAARAQRSVIVPATLAGQKVGTPERRAGLIQDTLAGWGVGAEVVLIASRDDAEDEDIVAPLRAADLIILPGGEARALVDTLAGTAGWHAVLAQLDAGATLTAAGGAAVSLTEVAYMPGEPVPASLDGLSFERFGGLGLLRGMVALPYFTWLQAGVTARIEALYPPGTWLAGLGEQAALLTDGEMWQVAGAGHVTLWQAGKPPLTISAGETLPGDLLPTHRLG